MRWPDGLTDAIRKPAWRPDGAHTLNGLSVETTGWEPALLTCFKRQALLALRQ